MTQRAMLRPAFDLGITRFDFADSTGPPHGSAEANFGEHLRRDFRPFRDGLVISTSAGRDRRPGAHGQGGGSCKHLLAGLDRSLRRSPRRRRGRAGDDYRIFILA